MWRRIGAGALRVLAWFLVWLGLVLLAAALDIRHVWGDVNIDQMLTNLVGVQGDGGGGALVPQAIWWIAVVPTLATALLIAARWWWKRRRTAPGRTLRWAEPVAAVVLVAAVMVTGSTAFSRTTGLPSYVRAMTSDLDLGAYNRTPQLSADGKPLNVVIIYLESGEAKLSDTSLFEKDMFAPLEDATRGWAQIDKYAMYEGGGWTMAGIGSTQCGIPLRGKTAATGDSIMNELSDTHQDTYMPGQTCLGDVLKAHGYTSEFLGGANGGFAAKDVFLRTHGYDEEKDLDTWKAMGDGGSDLRPDWGLSDQKLMEHAKDEVTAMHDASAKTGKPFNLSMLTLDTHEPVHVYPYCDVDTKDALASVWACSSQQVAGFIDYMRKKDYLKDTAVIVMGDHLKHMGGGDEYHEQLDGRTDRTIFNRIWIPGTADGVTPLGKPRDIDQLGMYATILDAVGLSPKDHWAGAGISAFAPSIPADAAQSLPADQYKELLDARSGNFYRQVWTDPAARTAPASQGAPSPNAP